MSKSSPRTEAILEELLKEVEPVRHNPSACVELIGRKLGDLAVTLEAELTDFRKEVEELQALGRLYAVQCNNADAERELEEWLRQRGYCFVVRDYVR